MRRQNHKKFFIFRFLRAACGIFLCAVLIGCTDSRYLAEKLLWRAQQKVNQILAQSKGKLTKQDYEGIVAAYRTVADACPLEPTAAQAQFTIANIYFMQGEYEAAINEFTRIIQNFSSTAKIASQAQFSIGRIYEAKGDWPAAVEEYDKIIDLYPLSALGLKMPIYIMKHYQDTEDLLGLDRAYKSAQRHYDALIDDFEETPVASRVSNFLALTYLQKGDIDEALGAFEDIINDYPQSYEAARSFLVKAELLERSGNLSGAIETYEDFIKRYPGHKIIPHILFKTGMLYFALQDNQKAKDIFSSLIKDYPDDANVAIKGHLGLAEYYKRTLDAPGVIAELETIENEFPHTMTALQIPYLKGLYYYDAQRTQEARRAFGEAISFYKSKIAQGDALTKEVRACASLLALCYLKNNETDAAVGVLQGLVDAHNSEPMYLVDLATLYISLNELEKALKVYETLLKKFPDNKFVVRLATSQIKSLSRRVSLQQ